MKLLLSILLLVEAFPLSEVRMTESRWRDNLERDSSWVCSITVQQALHNFRTTAGVFSALEGGYDAFLKMGGWESPDCDLRGHIVGHLLSTYALLYASTGEDIFRLKGDSIIQGLRQCQQVIGTGYISAFPQEFIYRNLRGEEVWAPWYTLHKLMKGVRDQVHLCHNDTAQSILNDFTQWALTTLPKDETIRQRAIRNEFGGIAEAVPELYEFFYHNEKMDPLYAGNMEMGTMHCNTFLPKVIVESQHSDEGRVMALRFFHEMVEKHCFVTGSISDKEHFFDPKQISSHLSGYTGESCCTYNMLRLAKALYPYYPNDPLIMDYYERALVNHILGQQDPQTGMLHYFLPMQTGAYKLYSTPMQSFWCCVGSGFESQANYADAIYWHNKQGATMRDTIYVNLFIPSVLDWQEKGLVLRQETSFPNGQSSTLVIDQAPAKALTIMIRQPQWTGKTGYKAYTRKWKKGDHISVSLPMTEHYFYTPDSAYVAIMNGPVVLAGQLGEVDYPFSDPTKHNDYYTYDYDVPDEIRTIRLSQKSEIELKPIYDTHHQRYVIYWKNE